MKRALRLPALIAAGLLFANAFAGIAESQEYPNRSITVIVPFPAGGPSDVVARIVTDQMSKTLGHSIVIENVGGAGGVIGSGRVAAATADGYTLLAGSMGSHVAAPVLTPNIRYNPQDFTPIGPTAHSPPIIVARKDFPAKDFREFVADVKEHGNGFKQAHGGVGSSSHMACLLFNAATGAKPTMVAYRGSGPAMNDMIGGHVDFFCEQSVSVVEQVKSGTVKAYAVAAGERLASLPELPTASEMGVSYVMSIWAGIFGPRAMPASVVAKLADALDKALDDPGVRMKINALGGSIPAKAERNPATFDAYVKAEITRWEPILKAAAEPPK
jgi:tripartite-type tricarboxylate transporter receptor subunit TctC